MRVLFSERCPDCGSAPAAGETFDVPVRAGSPAIRFARFRCGRCGRQWSRSTGTARPDARGQDRAYGR